ncbi:winged helix-turn-helix domain-containing protein [Methanolobus bombayensis]|uniref:winged helix-turn-helix domain-containing protein n=1 Tax=Methanolobus bombayensis TaxID=38023 RepID=UPI001AE46132|nr:winged helix-turn-helix domain-containing protein [Methanolobus bombayensis]MBP1910143.1 restriction system protein [Methanolobus bombayensis]
MSIPDYQTLMLPLLTFCSDSQEHSTKDCYEHLSSEFNLTEDEIKKLLPSGNQSVINNRVGWAKTYLVKSGLLFSPSRGYVKITDKGLDVLKTKPEKIDVKYLEQFPEFIEFKNLRREDEDSEDEDITPDELMEKGFNLIIDSLAQDLLDKLRTVDPYFFEQIVGELLISMNYGKFKPTPGSGDEGIDGIVYQDKLGLDKIFFQAKRYADGNPVTARDIRDFVGTLDLHGVNKGVFITTSHFPRDTVDILKRTPKHISLIDGFKLAQLMIDHDIGVSKSKAYIVKRIDSDYFITE